MQFRNFLAKLLHERRLIDANQLRYLTPKMVQVPVKIRVHDVDLRTRWSSFCSEKTIELGAKICQAAAQIVSKANVLIGDKKGNYVRGE